MKDINNKSKAWLYITRYLIPDTLLPLIENLDVTQQQNYCYIVNMIMIHRKDSPLEYTFIGANYFSDFIRNESYTKYISQLESWNIIDVNHKYFNDTSTDTTHNKSFTKSYRMHPLLNYTDSFKSFTKKQLQPMKDKSILINKETNTTDVYLDFIKSQCELIDCRDSLLPQVNIENEIKSEYDARKVHWRVFNIRYGKNVNRVYHSLITMPKSSRKNLVLKSNPSIPLFEYDIKAAHPFLLYKFITDATERKHYVETLNDCNQDFYENIYQWSNRQVDDYCEGKPLKSRDSIKLDFLHFIFGGVKNYFYEFFAMHFTNLFLFIKTTGFKQMAVILQNLESQIIIEETIAVLIKKTQPEQTYPTAGLNPINIEYLYIPQHDGWLGLDNKHSHTYVNIVKSNFKRIVGIEPVITKKNIITGEKVVV